MRHLLVSLLAACALALASCAAPSGGSSPAATVSPTQRSIDALYTSYEALNVAIASANSAALAGVLKGSDARNALAAFTKTKEGLDTALTALKNAQAAAAASAAASAPK